MDEGNGVTGDQSVIVPAPAQDPRAKRFAEVRSGNSWMQMVPILSGLNAAAQILNVPFRLVVGLAITDVVLAIGRALGPVPQIMGTIFVVAVAGGLYALAWLFKKTGKLWPAVVLIVLYTLDIIPALFFRDYFTAGFHLFALFFMVRGFLAFYSLLREARAAKAAAVVTPQPDVLPAEDAAI